LSCRQLVRHCNLPESELNCNCLPARQPTELCRHRSKKTHAAAAGKLAPNPAGFTKSPKYEKRPF
ncbi:MAG: hypothetical protein ACK5DM_06065, partial [Planctomyces sp.]